MEASTEQQDQDQEPSGSTDPKDKQEKPSASKDAKDRQDSTNGSGSTNVGRVEEITGVVIDVSFPEELPAIYSALETEIPPQHDEGEATRLVVEVQQHLGDDRVRCVAMDATDGLHRGAEIRDTGGPITVPVGDMTLGRIFNLCLLYTSDAADE